MGKKKDPYSTLGLAHDADQREIRSAYRYLAKKYHPDAGEGSSAEKFLDIQDAYDLLSDVGRKTTYDQLRSAQSESPAGYAGPYSSRPIHIDLRDITGPRARTYVEPIGFRFSRGSEDLDIDQWEDLLEFFFRAF